MIFFKHEPRNGSGEGGTMYTKEYLRKGYSLVLSPTLVTFVYFVVKNYDPHRIEI